MPTVCRWHTCCVPGIEGAAQFSHWKFHKCLSNTICANPHFTDEETVEVKYLVQGHTSQKHRSFNLNALV
jgi:hypothetical protein